MKGKEKDDKKRVGRPATNKDDGDRSRGYPVCITPNEKKALELKYGSITLALKSLL